MKVLSGVAVAAWLSFASLAPQVRAEPALVSAAAPDKAAIEAANVQLKAGIKLLQDHQGRAAIDQAFDKVIATFEARAKAAGGVIFCARSPEESAAYTAAPGPVSVWSSVWSSAYYLKGFALTDLNDLTGAEAALSRAVALSPKNAQYQNGLGDLYRMEKRWPQALAAYTAAEAATAVSPAANQDSERVRAWRGQGAVNAQQSRYDVAIKIYQKCLAATPACKAAEADIANIRKLRDADSAGN